MKFVYCSSCGKAQPAGTNCLWCGTAQAGSRAEEPVIRRNARSVFQAAERAVASGDRKNAAAQTDVLARLLPDTAAAYWLRSLAANGCRDAGELIANGVSAANDPDFAIALQTASGIELDAYQQIRETVSRVKTELVSALQKETVRLLRDANVQEMRDSFAKRTEECRRSLQERYAAVQSAENAILALETDGTVLIQDIVRAQRDSERVILNIEKELGSSAVGEPTTAGSLIRRIGTAFHRSEIAAGQYREMQETHPWREKSDALHRQLDQAAAACKKAEDDLAALNREISDKAEALEQRNTTLRDAIAAAGMYRFAAGFALIGREKSLAVLRQAGLHDPALPETIRKGR